MNNMPARVWQANIMLILSLNSCPAMIASDNEMARRDTANKLNEINTILLKEEIEILSINTELMAGEEKLSKAKGTRIALYNFIASTFINAGVITVASTKWATISNPHRASYALVQCGPIASMIGNSILLSGIFFESANDRFISWRKKASQTSAKAKINQLRDLYNQLTTLFAERERLVHDDITANPAELELSQREGKILAFIQHCCIEDTRAILSQRQFSKTARASELLAEITAASSAGYVGALFNIIANKKKNPILAKAAGIGYTVSGGTVAAEPILTNLLATMSQKRISKKLKKEFTEEEQPVSSLSSSDLLYSSEKSVLAESFNKRLSIYISLVGLLNDSQSKFDDMDRGRSRDLVRRQISNGIVGGTKLATGIMLTNACFSFNPNNKRASNILAKRVAIADTTFLPGASTWMANSVLARRRPDLQIFTMGTQNNDFAQLSLGRRNILGQVLTSLHDLQK